MANVLEWFDFAAYTYFAVTISQVFFPTGNSTASLLITFGTFGLAYFARSSGALLIGNYTDRRGRKAGLTLSIVLMMIGTTLMAVTPSYAAIGLTAPILITLARLQPGSPWAIPHRDACMSGAYLFQLPAIALARDPAFRCRLKATVPSRRT